MSEEEKEKLKQEVCDMIDDYHRTGTEVLISIAVPDGTKLVTVVK